MKWIGQHIWDFISRFRSDVYLEDLTESAQDHVVGVDADGKLYKQDVSTGDMTGVDISVGAGLDISQSNTTGGNYTSTIDLDLTEVGVSGSANQLLTDDGDGTVTSESGLKFTGNILTVDGVNDVKITSSINGLGYSPDVISTASNIIALSSYNVFGTGAGGLLEQQDFTSGSVSGAATAWKGSGSNGTNKPGGDMHVIAGRGTGSQPGGSFKFWSSPAGGSGSSYNTSAIKFIIDSSGNITSYGNFKFAVADSKITFEGGTYDTILKAATSPSGSDKTITLPDANGTVALTSDIPTVPRSIMAAAQPSTTLIYLFKGNTWQGANGSFQLDYGSGSVPNTGDTGATLAQQVLVPIAHAISNMTVYKVTMNWYWTTKYGSVQGARNFEFSFHTATALNNNQTEQTLSSAITATNNNGAYTNDYQYITTWEFASGSGVSISAGDNLNIFARNTSFNSATTITSPMIGQIWVEYKYN